MLYFLRGFKKEKYINIWGKGRVSFQKGGELSMALDSVILAVIIGTLAAIVYSLRILVLMERRIAKIDLNLERIVGRIANEEIKIEGEERRIEAMLRKRRK